MANIPQYLQADCRILCNSFITYKSLVSKENSFADLIEADSPL